MRGTPLKRLAKGAQIRNYVVNCESNFIFLVNPPIDGYRIATHRGCSCNELIALHNRHLIDRELREYDKEYMLSQFRKVSRSWKFNVEKMPMHEIVKGYTGGKRRMYYRAMLDLKFGLRPTDSHISMFVKPDKYPESDIQDKAPRAIQYRHPRYNLSLAVFLKPFEHHFYELEGSDGLRVITKGMNHTELARLFLEKISLYEDPVFIECDHSKFDSTINVHHLKFEHSVYNRTFKSSHLRLLLRKQLFNKGYSRNGLKYYVKGTRMSGDYNTGLGNSLLNRAVLESWLTVPASIMLDGDDSVIILERRDVKHLDFSHFAKCGFTTEIALRYEMNKVEYCRRRLVLCDPPMFVRNPLRMNSGGR